jgi:hypothetical protein
VTSFNEVAPKLVIRRQVALGAGDQLRHGVDTGTLEAVP